MASEVEVVNIGLTLLGESRIASLDDNTKPAREAKAIFTAVRDALLAKYNWNFAKERTALSALVSTPAFQYSVEYQLPADCLRLVELNDYFVGIDLTDYRGSDTREYAIEGRKIKTNWAAPLNIKYIKRVTDASQFDPVFGTTMGARMAMDLCESLTQSDSKWQKAAAQYKQELSDAVRVNAIALPPQKLADDEWLLSRL